MRKLYASLLALAMMVGFSTNARASYYQNLSDPDTLLTLFPGYEVYKFYDFYAWTVNDEEMGDWGYGSEVAFTLASLWSMVQCTADGMTNFYFANADNGYGDLVVSYRSGYGIYNYGSGYRPIVIADMQPGQIVVLECNSNQTYDPVDSIYSAYSDVAVSITDSIHALQYELYQDSDYVDEFFYYEIKEAGYFAYVMARADYIPALAILQSEDAEEFVTSPSLTVTKVNYEAREITVTDGYSSVGNEVTTWYSLDGSEPLFLVDTDEIASADTIWSEDSLTYELENITYVQVPQPDEDGYYGDILYEGEPIAIDSNDDDDGDGYVTIKMATVSSTGAYSSTVELSVSVGEITLNEPVLTLYDLDGTSRGYSLSWTNNTLCGEDYTFSVETESSAENYEEGEVIYATDYIYVTVSAEGYNDGTLELEDLTDEGVNYYRKNTEKYEAGEHDWDFVNLDNDMLAKFQGTELAYYIVVSGEDTTYYDVDADPLPDTAEEVYADYGWTYDSSKYRSWRNVLVDTLTTTASDGTDSTYTEAYYADDTTGLFDGLTITCDPYTNSSSVWSASWAVYTNGGGVYNMSAMTVDIEDIVYGEYALATLYGDVVLEKLEDAAEGLTITISKQSYWYYLDIFTADDLGEYDAITNVNADSSKAGNIYSLDGRLIRRNTTKFDGLQPGLYIQNGKKYLVK